MKNKENNINIDISLETKGIDFHHNKINEPSSPKGQQSDIIKFSDHKRPMADYNYYGNDPLLKDYYSVMAKKRLYKMANISGSPIDMRQPMMENIQNIQPPDQVPPPPAMPVQAPQPPPMPVQVPQPPPMPVQAPQPPPPPSSVSSASVQAQPSIPPSLQVAPSVQPTDLSGAQTQPQYQLNEAYMQLTLIPSLGSIEKAQEYINFFEANSEPLYAIAKIPRTTKDLNKFKKEFAQSYISGQEEQDYEATLSPAEWFQRNNLITDLTENGEVPNVFDIIKYKLGRYIVLTPEEYLPF